MEAFLAVERRALHRIIHSLSTALRSQIHHVDVGSEPDIIGEVPADVIGIVVNDDVVRIPEPVVTETKVVWSYGEIETAEPEAAGTTASKAKDVAATNTTGEVTMLPGMIQMVMRVVAAGIMAYPSFASIDVRSIGMSFLFAEVAVFLRWMRSAYFRRTVLRDVLTAAADLRPAATAGVLCQG